MFYLQMCNLDEVDQYHEKHIKELIKGQGGGTELAKQVKHLLCTWQTQSQFLAHHMVFKQCQVSSLSTVPGVNHNTIQCA